MLEKFQVNPHPVKEILTRFNIPLGTVSKFLGLSYAYTSLLLSGNCQMPKKHDRRLWQLVNELEKEKAAEASA